LKKILVRNIAVRKLPAGELLARKVGESALQAAENEAESQTGEHQPFSTILGN
jgi:hypothetical protein